MKILKYPGFAQNENTYLITMVCLSLIIGNIFIFEGALFWGLAGLVTAIIFLPGIIRLISFRQYSGYKYRFDASLPSKLLFGKNHVLKLAGFTGLGLGLEYLLAQLWAQFVPKFFYFFPLLLIVGYIAYMIWAFISAKNENDFIVRSLRVSTNKLVVIKNHFVNEFNLSEIENVKVEDSKLMISEQSGNELINHVFDVSTIADWHLAYFKQQMDSILSGNLNEFAGDLNPAT